MDKERLSRRSIVILCILICITSCTYTYKNNISDILCVRDASVIASDRYESHAVGEWYILESYVLSDKTARKVMTNMDVTLNGMEKHPILEDCYWMGWHPIAVHSTLYSILLESAHFHSNNLLVQEYENCCRNNVGYYTIIIKDPSKLYNDFFEKTAVVFNSKTKTIYICNYHY